MSAKPAPPSVVPDTATETATVVTPLLANCSADGHVKIPLLPVAGIVAGFPPDPSKTLVATVDPSKNVFPDTVKVTITDVAVKVTGTVPSLLITNLRLEVADVQNCSSELPELGVVMNPRALNLNRTS